MEEHILIVEDESVAQHASVTSVLGSDGRFTAERCAWEGIQNGRLRDASTQAIVAVAVEPRPEVLSGLRLLADPSIAPALAVLPEEPDPKLLCAVEGLHDMIFRPVRAAELYWRLERILPARECDLQIECLRLTEDAARANLVGKHPSFLRAVQRTSLIGASEAPVLLSGETGTGKELCARAIHFFSARKDGPFIPVECGAIPDALAESELFGHARGAFTDAYAQHKGLVGMAEGGTLFLDEIDALSLASQARILRFIEERTYRPLGAERASKANVRVVAASNCNLERLVAERSFRGDLFFRLNVLSLHLPPLRERGRDVELLAQHFLRELCLNARLPQKSLSPAAVAKLMSHNWPGNVRELYNVMQRAVAFAQQRLIAADDIDLPARSAHPEKSATFRAARSACLEQFERAYVEELLSKHGGNITRAAREAGKDRRAFGRLAKKYNLPN